MIWLIHDSPRFGWQTEIHSPCVVVKVLISKDWAVVRHDPRSSYQAFFTPSFVLGKNACCQCFQWIATASQECVPRAQLYFQAILHFRAKPRKPSQNSKKPAKPTVAPKSHQPSTMCSRKQIGILDDKIIKTYLPQTRTPFTEKACCCCFNSGRANLGNAQEVVQDCFGPWNSWVMRQVGGIWQPFWHSTWHFIWHVILSDILSYILSDIWSDIHCGILSDILSYIYSDMLSGMLSCISLVYV